MDSFQNQLECRIKARNRCHEVANELFPQLLEVFKLFAGQKVCKVDGTWLKKVADLLPESNYPDKWPDPTVMYYRNVSEYTVSFTVKTCASNNDGGCAYEEATIYICDLSNGIVKGHRTSLQDMSPTDARWYDQPNLRTDWTAAEVTRRRKVFAEKRADFELARSDLGPFGEFDR